MSKTNKINDFKQTRDIKAGDLLLAAKALTDSVNIGAQAFKASLKLYSYGEKAAIKLNKANAYRAHALKSSLKIGRAVTNASAQISGRALVSRRKMINGYKMVYGKVKRVRT